MWREKEKWSFRKWKGLKWKIDKNIIFLRYTTFYWQRNRPPPIYIISTANLQHNAHCEQSIGDLEWVKERNIQRKIMRYFTCKRLRLIDVMSTHKHWRSHTQRKTREVCIFPGVCVPLRSPHPHHIRSSIRSVNALQCDSMRSMLAHLMCTQLCYRND